MKCLRLAALLLMLALAALMPFAPQAWAQSGTTDELRVHITQVNSGAFPTVTVYLSVTDAAGEPVGIDPSRLQLMENGERIQPESVQGVGGVDPGSLSVLLVVDVSGSMNQAGKLRAAQRAAHAFVEQMRPSDRIGLIAFNTQVSLVQPLTESRPSLLAAIDGLRAQTDTAMYDALLQAADVLADEPGRKAIVALTDGMDNVSEHGLQEVLAAVSEAGATISAVGLGDPEQRDATTAGIDEPALQTLTAQAGGEYAYVSDQAQLAALYERYARALQSEYVLTYTSPGGLRDGLTRRLSVSLVDVAGVEQAAAYNPGGLVPEVAEPASSSVFFSALLGLTALLLAPGLIRAAGSLLRGAAPPLRRKPKPRIRFKDT